MMEKLLNLKVQPVHDEIAALKTHGVSWNELCVKLEPIQTKLDELTTRVEALGSGRSHNSDQDSKASSKFLGSEVAGSVIEAKIQQMEKQLSELRTCDPKGKNALFGGLDKFGSTEDAAVWMKSKISEAACEVPLDMFDKGGFNGLVFGKIKSVEARNAAVIAIQRARIQYLGTAIWAKEDLPIEKRIPESFLFGLKKVMLGWKYTTEEVYVDKTDHILSVGVGRTRERIVTATVADGRFMAKWATEWEAWTEYSSSAEVQALCKKATETLQRSATKGSGRGKKGKKGANGAE